MKVFTEGIKMERDKIDDKNISTDIEWRRIAKKRLWVFFLPINLKLTTFKIFINFKNLR